LDRDQRAEAEEAQRQATRAEDGGARSVEEHIRQVLQLLDAESAQEALELLASMHPADQALVVRAVSSEVRDSLARLLPVAQLAAILEHLDAEEAAPVLQRLDPSSIAGVLDAVRPEVAADVLRQIPAEGVVKALSETVRAEEIVPLMAYPDETAGGLMTPVIVTVSEETTVAQAMALLRHIAPLPQQQTSFFVVDFQRKLLGNVSLPSLVFSSLESRVNEVMTETVASVGPDVDQEECAHLMERYDLAELPVVDDAGRLLGVIPFPEVFDIAEEEATEDMYRLAGLGTGEHVASTLGRSIMQRLPWLLLNLGTVLLAASVIAAFRSTIAQLVILAAFLPVVAGQGGAAGTQTLTLVVRSIALGEISFRSNRGIVGRELLLAAINGIVLGALVGVVGFIWEDSIVLGLALLVAMIANMMVAALAGALIPLGLRAVGLDPALASVVLVTTFTDVAGFAVFLGAASFLLLYF
jgi:magnesium transporter